MINQEEGITHELVVKDPNIETQKEVGVKPTNIFSIIDNGLENFDDKINVEWRKPYYIQWDMVNSREDVSLIRIGTKQGTTHQQN